MRLGSIVKGEWYHLKDNPAYPWIKVLDTLPPYKGVNRTSSTLIKCFHSSSATPSEDFGLIRYFKAAQITAAPNSPDRAK